MFVFILLHACLVPGCAATLDCQCIYIIMVCYMHIQQTYEKMKVGLAWICSLSWSSKKKEIRLTLALLAPVPPPVIPRCPLSFRCRCKRSCSRSWSHWETGSYICHNPLLHSRFLSVSRSLARCLARALSRCVSLSLCFKVFLFRCVGECSFTEMGFKIAALFDAAQICIHVKVCIKFTHTILFTYIHTCKYTSTRIRLPLYPRVCVCVCVWMQVCM